MMEKVVLTTQHNKRTQTQSHRIHRVHQELGVRQFSIDQIEPGGHLDGCMTMYRHDNTLIHVVLFPLVICS